MIYNIDTAGAIRVATNVPSEKRSDDDKQRASEKSATRALRFKKPA